MSLVWIFLAVVLIVLFIFFLIMKFLDNYKLKKLRRKYDGIEDKSKGRTTETTLEELGLIGKGELEVPRPTEPRIPAELEPRTIEQLDSPKYLLERDEQPERRELLQIEPVVSSRENQREYGIEQASNGRSVAGYVTTDEGKNVWLTPLQKRVLDLLNQGNLMQKEIAERIGKNPQDVSSVVKALRKKGVWKD